MWYRVQAWQDGQAISTIDAGYTSHGIVGNDDSQYVGNPAYSQTMVIDAYQFNSLATFGSFDARTGNSNSQAAINAGFANGDNYSVLTNSCIDFVYAALHYAGLNPTGYQGDLVPMWNQDNINKMFGYVDEHAKEMLPYMIMENELQLTDEQIAAIMLNEDLNGMTITLEDGSTIYLATNSLDGLGNVISSTTILPNGLEDASSSYFFNENGDFLGNITSFDPQSGIYIPITGLPSELQTVSALENFNNQFSLNALIATNSATSSFAYDDSVFNRYLLNGIIDGDIYENYSWNFSVENFLNQEDAQDLTKFNFSDFQSNPTYTGPSAEDIAEYYGNTDGFELQYNSDGTTSGSMHISFNTWSDLEDIFNQFIDSLIGLADRIWNAVEDIFDSIGDFFSDLFPIVLDLDGDGIELIPISDSATWFDIKNDGTLHQTSWVGTDDGLLAYDENGDGKITNGKEIAFADRTALATDTDLEALASEFDSNKDGVLDSKDANFDKFKIWQDKNSNGISETGEVKSLNDAGILSLSLVGNKVNYAIEGNGIKGFTTFTKTDGTVGYGADVALQYEDVGYTTKTENGYMVIKETGNNAVYAIVTDTNGKTLDINALGLGGATGGSGNDILNATNAKTKTILNGGAGNDTLNGGAGDDWLDGGEGADTINGGAGNDTIIIDSSDVISKINGGAGFDTLIMSGTSNISLNLTSQGIESATGNMGDNIFTSTSSYTIFMDGKEGNDTLTSGSGRDMLYGGNGNDTIKAGGGDDFVYGEDGNDTIDGGVGTDTMNGGAGNDIYFVDNVKDVVFENENEGTDTVRSSVTYTLGKNLENLMLTGTGAINATGNALSNFIIGNSGANTIDGGVGKDIMSGGAGNDTYVVDDTGDIIRERANKGTDTVKASATYILGTNVENLTLIGTAAINGTGNTLNNTIIGNTANNILSGGAGNDTLNGGAGIDTASYEYETVGVTVNLATTSAQTIQGTQKDTLSSIENLTGSNYNDTLKGSTAANTITGLGGNDTIVADRGNDLLYGEAGNDSIYGNEGRDYLNGNEGSDTLTGGLGNDYLNGGDGSDIFVFNSNFIMQNFVRNIVESPSQYASLAYNENMFMMVNSVLSNDPDRDIDTIADFDSKDDTINLENAIFTKLTATGLLNSANYKANSTGSATDTNDFILYNTTNGNLSYDADGNGAGVAVTFAILANKPTDLSYLDFVVI